MSDVMELLKRLERGEASVNPLEMRVVASAARRQVEQLRRSNDERAVRIEAALRLSETAAEQTLEVREMLERERTLCDELAEALRLTQEYVGDAVLPALEGWSWWDALVKWREARGVTPPGDVMASRWRVTLEQPDGVRYTRELAFMGRYHCNEVMARAQHLFGDVVRVEPLPDLECFDPVARPRSTVTVASTPSTGVSPESCSPAAMHRPSHGGRPPVATRVDPDRGEVSGSAVRVFDFGQDRPRPRVRMPMTVSYSYDPDYEDELVEAVVSARGRNVLPTVHGAPESFYERVQAAFDAEAGA